MQPAAAVSGFEPMIPDSQASPTLDIAYSAAALASTSATLDSVLTKRLKSGIFFSCATKPQGLKAR